MSPRSTPLRSLAARLLQTRGFARAPVPVFRMGLGFLLTRRLLLLEHVGRKSGSARYVVLEVVEHASPPSLVVASGFGPAAQWFRNVEAEPHCYVSIGFRRRVPAVAAVLEPAERDAALARYRVSHATAWERLSAIITEATGSSDPQIPLVRLSLER